MVKNLWECSVKECGEKAVVPEDCIPTGWVRLDFAYHSKNCTDCAPGVVESDEEEGAKDYCITLAHVEACSTEHAFLAAKEIFNKGILISEEEQDHE